MVYIIAEIGCNHNGDFELAKEMTLAAIKTGANCVKFQSFKAENLVTKNAQKADYQNENDQTKSQFEMLKKLELNIEQVKELKKICKTNNVDFTSTPFDLVSIDELDDLGVDVWKIPSGEITNLPYLRKIAKIAEKVIISTGMCTLEDIFNAVKIFELEGVNDISILHCNTQYPTPIEDVNMLVLKTLKENFENYKIGFSDHTIGITAPTIAVALGAEIIEKHFTLDNDLPGPDHKASANFETFSTMVNSIREAKEMLGSAEKMITESEKTNINAARKSIVACKNIKKGELLTEDNLTCKRPGNGISPMKWDSVVGLIATKDYSIDELINEEIE